MTLEEMRLKHKRIFLTLEHYKMKVFRNSSHDVIYVITAAVMLTIHFRTNRPFDFWSYGTPVAYVSRGCFNENKALRILQRIVKGQYI